MCRRRGRGENARGRLRTRSARKKRHTTHRHPERTTGVEPDLATTCHLSSWEERQNSPTSTSARVDDADERHVPGIMLNHREFSYERGCQARKLPPAPRKGKLFGLHPARCLRLGVTRPVAVISRRFHVSDGGSTPSAREAAQAEVLAPDNVPTMILCETRGL